MAELLLSEAERTYIVHGIQQNVRQDGRSREDYRYIELETDFVPHLCGSARVRLSNTDILAGVKAEIGEPSEGSPKEGYLKFFIDCSANATPDFEGRGGEALAEGISSMLENIYLHKSTLDYEKLGIIPGKKCWVLYVDVLILEVGGNLIDAISLAVKAALFNSKIPNLTVVTSELNEAEIELSDDPYDCFRLDVSRAPCIVTLNKVLDKYIVDASLEEETCISSRIILGVQPDGTVTGLKKDGQSGINPTHLIEVTKMGVSIGLELNKKLTKALLEEESMAINPNVKLNTNCGFLR
ncbi:hypothetical protein HELRODRAFT_108114 [Helobdella robusta]|uniref:Ribosomal RNA-processing protein 42 n=1 Tax=Helobdella robusta TaxID=6412 RepID=T1EEF6_HELRO|nr:hypothetical protein HELRODRAFT_108114 [Helobdella robusta]ESN92713.1 hypothetical protein HELRODRAFT_108114 [Helobdella robusta]